MSDKKQCFIALHVGAGFHSPAKHNEYKKLCSKACNIGMKLLKGNKTCIEVVDRVCSILEDSPLTNAGYGSNLSMNGLVEGEAGIMESSTSGFGAVSCLKCVKNPIKLARILLEEQLNASNLVPPIVLSGDGAYKKAVASGLELVKNDELTSPQAINDHQRYKRILEYSESGKRKRKKLDDNKEIHVHETSDSLIEDKTGDPINKVLFDDTETSLKKNGSELSSCTTSFDGKLGNTAANSHCIEDSCNSMTNKTVCTNNHEDNSLTNVRNTLDNTDHENEPYDITTKTVRSNNEHSYTKSNDEFNRTTFTNDNEYYLHTDERNTTSNDHVNGNELSIDTVDKRTENRTSDDHSYTKCSSLIDNQSNYVDNSTLNNRGEIDVKSNNGHSYCLNVEFSDPISAVFDDSIDQCLPLPDSTSSLPSKLHDTIGVVCIDTNLDIASGVSSGGIVLKQQGRVGHASHFGCGCWAFRYAEDFSIGCCTSGCGELLIRTGLAKRAAEFSLDKTHKVLNYNKFIEEKFLNSPYIDNCQGQRLCGLLLVKLYKDINDQENNLVDLQLAHTSESFGVAFLSSDMSKPRFIMSRLEKELVGSKVVTQGFELKL